MKYKVQMQVKIDLNKPAEELAATISAVLNQYPLPRQKREILQLLELEIANGLNALDEAEQAAGGSEGGEAGESQIKTQKEPETAG